MLAIILGILLSFLGAGESHVTYDVAVIAPVLSEGEEWSEFWTESYEEHEDMFTALFNSYEYKLSKNGRSMINGKFVKMGA